MSAIDFDLLRKKFQDLEKRTSGSETSIFWKPTGTHVIRILPYKHDPKLPFRELFFHYNVDVKPHVSPISYGNPDPILEFAKELQNSGNTDDWKMGKKLEPKQRTHAFILVRGLEEEGVKLWGFSDTVYRELMDVLLDPDYGDITDYKTGRDITVTLTPGTEGNYAKTSVRPKPSTSIVTESKDVFAKIQEMPEIETICKATPYDTLLEVLKKKLSPNNENEEAVVQTEAPKADPAPSAKTDPAPASESVGSAMDMFDSLINK